MPDTVSFNTALKAAVSAGRAGAALDVWSAMLAQSVPLTPATFAALLSVAGEAGYPNSACQVYMHPHNSWNQC